MHVSMIFFSEYGKEKCVLLSNYTSDQVLKELENLVLTGGQ